MRILVADDDAQLQRALRVTLGANGYEVIAAADGAEALDLAGRLLPDLYLLDLGMPRLDGVDVIRSLRRWSTAPILVVSGRVGSGDKVHALDAGADDYVTKPFSMDELLARIRALTRRFAPADPGGVVVFGDVSVDLAAKAVTRAGSPVRLTPTEWHLLELLLRSPDVLVSRATLLREIWGPTHIADTGYLRLYIAQLRKKLEADPAQPRHLITESGMGYRFAS